MRIGIDGRMLGNTGIGRYLKNLLIHLAQQDRENEYVVFINDDSMRIVSQGNFIFVTLRPSIPIYSWREHVQFTFEIRRWKPALMHYPNFDVPLFSPCPYVVTIHDLIYYLYPRECPSKVAHHYAAFMMKYATKHAHSVITDSEHSKQDLIRFLRVPEKKIQIILPAAEKSYLPKQTFKETESDFKQQYGITRPYILYVGKHHSYKNIKQLLYAYTQHDDIYRSFQLVIAGKRDARRNDLYECAKTLDPLEHIRFTDNVPDPELVTLYQEASLFVFPSLYEGFGLPPLEAMACGVPVISSNAASLPEVVGDAAILVSPENTEEIADAMRRILTDRTLWGMLQRKGLKQAQKFSWYISAEAHRHVYERCIASRIC